MDTLAVQTALAKLGYAIVVDGVSGPKTLAAIKAFQTAHQLRADGIVGPQTIKALQAATAEPAEPRTFKPFAFPSAKNLADLFPRARSQIIVPFAQALPVVCPKLAMDTVLRLGHFMGQCAVESAYFDTYEEYASGAAYEGRKDLGNVNPGDGKLYKGRGPLQLTGRDNYRRATPWVASLLGRPDLDLVKTPAIVSSDKAVGLATSLWFWDSNKLNAWADKDDAEAVSRGVNRGNPRTAKPANAEAERIATTHKVVAMLNDIQKG